MLFHSTELTGGHRVDRVLAGKEPDLRPRRLPPVAQQFEQLRREHHITIPLPLPLLDPESHALAVNVGHLQVRDFGHAQARALGDAERRLVLEARRGFRDALIWDAFIAVAGLQPLPAAVVRRHQTATATDARQRPS
jgi:hypothetical protein